MVSEMSWPDVFITGEASYSNDENGRRIAIAGGLTGWGCCQMGSKPPEKFGHGMAAIGKRLGIAAAGDNLMKLADELKL